MQWIQANLANFLLICVFVTWFAFLKISGNPANHATSYRVRRALNWLPMGLTYAFLYMGRYNLTVAKSALGGLMPVEAFGTIFAVGAWVYALAFLLNGPIVDKIGGKKGILIGAFGAAVANFLMGYLVFLRLNGKIDMNLTMPFCILYGLNMYFQSYGAVSIVKVNAHWFHVRERGSFSGIFGTLISLGLYFAFDWSAMIVKATKMNAEGLSLVQRGLRSLVGANTATMDQTWWVFFIPAVILFIFCVIEIFLLKDSPSLAGHKDFDTHDASSGEEHIKFSVMQLYKKILTNPIIITIAVIEFCSGVLRNGIMHWYRIFLAEQGVPKDFFFLKHWGLLLMVCGVYSAIVAGFVSDKIFKSRRTPVAALFYGLMTACTIGMIFSLTSNVVLGVWSMLISLCVIGVHGLLSGTATMDFGGRKGAATAVGVIDGFVYLGTGVQSLAIGHIVKDGNWTYWPVFLVPFALIGTLLAIKIWHAFPGAVKGKGGH